MKHLLSQNSKFVQGDGMKIYERMYHEDL